MAKKDYYDILGVAKGASKDEMKKAYRKKAMQHHPDRNPDDAEAEKKFKELNEAYDVLKDDQKRGAYDQFGHAAFEGGMGGRGGGAGFDGSGFTDIFEEMFGDFMGAGGQRGGGGGRARPTRGSDVRANLEISLEQAFKGTKAKIRVPTMESCDRCEGSGAEPGTQPETCGNCAGQGKVRVQQGFFTIERACPNCGGAGRAIKDPCKNCSGGGRIRKEKKLEVQVPAGVEDGTRIRLSGEGEAGARGGPSGDLYVFVSVKPHRFFKRDGANLHCRVPVSMVEASIGGHVEVPLIDGKKNKVTIPAGTQAGTQLRLKGKGMSVLRSQSRGNMYIEIAVETPVNLSKKQKDLLNDFAGQGKSRNNSPESQGFFSKVKDLWDDLKD